MNNTVIEMAQLELPAVPMLWSVLIDTNCGCRTPDWVENSEPKYLFAALDESIELRRQGWITRVEAAA